MVTFGFYLTLAVTLGLTTVGSIAVTTTHAASSPAAPQQLEVYFAPYDVEERYTSMYNISVLQADIALVQEVVAAKKAYDTAVAASASVSAPITTTGKDSGHGHGVASNSNTNPFQIHFCVYNLLDTDYIDALILAAKAGVFVQVLMDYKNINQPYVHTYETFKEAGLAVAPSKTTSQKDLTPQQLATLNLVGVEVTGIMHMKLRYFSWLAAARTPPDTDIASKEDTNTTTTTTSTAVMATTASTTATTTGTPTEVVVSGSLNPEDTALQNEDTLVVIRDDKRTIGAYKAALASVVAPKPTATNAYDPSLPVNVLFSQANVSKSQQATGLARRVLLELVRAEQESVLISVYSLRSLADGEGLPLVGELCAAHRRGVAVAVITDKGQADGEAGFAGGDNTLTALRIWQCGIPVYKAENYATKYTALHHKNAVFGLKTRRIVWTDTANWSEASMGNGTSTSKPHNSETSLVIDSFRADSGRTGLRFLSNFLQLTRKYAYQQACPYTRVKGIKKYTERAQCASAMKWNQPDWVQPDARNVTAALINTAETKSKGTWPVVHVTFTLDLTQSSLKQAAVAAAAAAAAAAADSGLVPRDITAEGGKLLISVNGGANITLALVKTGSQGSYVAKADIPFGSVVDATAEISLASSLNVVTKVKKKSLTVGQRRGLVADAAFDWNVSPPTRKSATELDSMSLSIKL